MARNMSPEQVQSMYKMSANMGMPGAASSGAPSTSGGAPAATVMAGGMPDVSAMLRNPDAMKGMMASMQAMGEDDLAGMLRMSQPNLSEEQAHACALSFVPGFTAMSLVICRAPCLLRRTTEVGFCEQGPRAPY